MIAPLVVLSMLSTAAMSQQWFNTPPMGKFVREQGFNGNCELEENAQTIHKATLSQHITVGIMQQ